MAEVNLPWQPDHEIESNIAIGSLRDSILAWLTTGRGVHVETLMTVVGKLAGFAAQCAAWDAVRRSGKPAPKDGLVLATTPSGERFYFGDLINGYLVPEGAREWTVWGFGAAAAVEAGLPEARLPDYVDMFRHASATIGTGDFGIPRVSADHRPHLSPKEALVRFWPAARAILARTDGPEPGKSVPVEYWPAILGLVARQYILMAREALDPAMSLSLVMESAITMSKVDPDSIPTTASAAPEMAR
ncbi:MAG: hypothetical protein KDK07_11660 [Bauldia sp.]|nr:hypothetical protein [Bauldia sp.]